MKNLKLTIDMLPKGAWGKNLSKTIPQKDWDVIRKAVYEKADNKCSCCGKSGDLEAHEVWDFDISTGTQTLTDIVALCTACHGVKHIRHSQMIGYGEHAKVHFLKVNNCSLNDFAEHFFDAQNLFDERNKIDKWVVEVPALDL